MSATLRFKQLLFIAAALALVSLGLVAALSPASPARADDTQPCVETQDSYTEWAQTGTIVQHGDATPPGTNTDLKEYRGPTETKHVTQEFEEGTPEQDTRVWWVFRGQNGDSAPAADSDLWKAQPNLPAAQSQHSYPGENGLGNPYQPGANAGNGDWFRFTGTLIPAGEDTPEESHTDYTWTVWEREFVEGVDCPDPDPGPDCEANPHAEGCPPVDNGKKIVVCKYTGTPPGGLSHIIVVSENTLNNVEDEEGNPFTGVFPFEWTDAQGQAGGSIAIGYDDSGLTLSDCPAEEEPECPDGDHNGEAPGCDEEDPECPDGDHNGEAPGCEEPDPGPDCEEDPTQAHCEEDDPDCVEDPSQKKCDEDNNPPVIVPDDGTTPNSPSNGPTVRGASATAPTAAAGTTVAGTPAAPVPTAVNAGLAPQELADNGGTVGLLGIAAALLGAALIGLTVRPKRRIGAASHART